MSANVIVTDDRGFASTVLQADMPVLVDFWAPWCPPCRMIAPILDDLAGVYQGRLRVVKVNADDSVEVAGQYGIHSLPSLVFFKDVREVQRIIGAWPRAKLAAAIDEVLAAAGSQVA
jgi:thioredoxin 1